LTEKKQSQDCQALLKVKYCSWLAAGSISRAVTKWRHLANYIS